LKSDLCYFNLKVVPDFICVFIWLCYFFGKHLLLLTACTQDQYVLLFLICFYFQNINLKFLFMNYISYCSTLFHNYFCSDNLLAKSNYVDIILYSQHHNHASYINDDVNNSLKRKCENKTVSLESIEEDNLPLKLLKRNIKKEKIIDFIDNVAFYISRKFICWYFVIVICVRILLSLICIELLLLLLMILCVYV